MSHSSDRADLPARSDLPEGIAWMALGTAALIGALGMDRLEAQGVSPSTAPGLLPGLLGIALLLFGGLLTLRGIRNRSTAVASPRPGGQWKRLALVLALCLVFDVGLVGSGLPFWVAASLFMTVTILVLQQPERAAAGQRPSIRHIGVAALIGLGTALGATFVFQDLFLVRLP